MKPIISLAITVFFCFCVTVTNQAETIDRVVAVVNGEVITFSMLENEMNALWTEPHQLPKSLYESLQKLIDHKLMLQEARRYGIVVSEQNISHELADIASKFSSEEEFSKTLERFGITYDHLKKRLKEEILVREMVDRKFRLFVEVSGDTAAYYEQHKEKFVVLESVKIDQISFQFDPNSDESKRESIREKAEQILQEVRAKDVFSKYADDEDVEDYNPVNKLPPPIAEAISRLEIGEISDLIETPAGYFIIKLNDRRPTRQATFGEVRGEIESLLIQQKTRSDLEAWLKRQRDTGDIRIKVKLDRQ
jgi:peptidyl-prolyl cis-trans isomerase SurA